MWSKVRGLLHQRRFIKTIKQEIESESYLAFVIAQADYSEKTPETQLTYMKNETEISKYLIEVDSIRV